MEGKEFFGEIIAPGSIAFTGKMAPQVRKQISIAEAPDLGLYFQEGVAGTKVGKDHGAVAIADKEAVLPELEINMAGGI
jgi:hypothetical protein